MASDKLRVNRSTRMQEIHSAHTASIESAAALAQTDSAATKIRISAKTMALAGAGGFSDFGDCRRLGIGIERPHPP